MSNTIQNRRVSLPKIPLQNAENNNNNKIINVNVNEESSKKKQKKAKLSIVNMPAYLQRKAPPTAPKNLDTLLGMIGSFGLYQKFEFFLVGFLAILPSMVAYSYVFVSATPKFTCKTASEINKISLDMNNVLIYLICLNVFH
jgi:hypothetical protein